MCCHFEEAQGILFALHIMYASMSLSFPRIGIIVFGLMLVGAGCSSSLLGSCLITTPWGSCIDENKIDSGLLGVWQLTDQTLQTPAGNVTNPFYGRTLTFKIETLDVPDPVNPSATITEVFGAYEESWGSETGTGDKEVATPSEGVAESACEVTGNAFGTWGAWHGSDFDNTNPDGTFPVQSQLEIAPSSGDGPIVVCSAGGSQVHAKAGSTPLGEGYGTFAVSGGGVVYDYTLDASLTTLVLTGENPVSDVKNILTFTRLSY